MVVSLEEIIGRAENPEYREALEEFQYITLIENYIDEDCECFLHVEDYLRLLDDIVELSGLKIANISGSVADERFVFAFELGGKMHSFSIPAATGDWFDESFLTEFNDVLRNAGIEKGIYAVFVAGLKFADQILNLVYLDVAIYQELTLSKHGYVWDTDAYEQMS